MKKKLSSRGFGVIEGLLIFVIVGLIGSVGWYVYKMHTDDSKSTPSVTANGTTTQKVSSASKSVDPYAGWQEHCSSSSKVCFRYPSDWTFTPETPDDYYTSDPNVDKTAFDQAKLTSPNGTSISWADDVQGIGGACDQGVDPNTFIKKVEPTKVAGVYLIETTVSNKLSSVGLVSKVNEYTPEIKIGDTGTCTFYTLFKTSSSSKILLLEARNEAIKGNDLSTVEKILLTFHNQI